MADIKFPCEPGRQLTITVARLLDQSGIPNVLCGEIMLYAYGVPTVAWVCLNPSPHIPFWI